MSNRKIIILLSICLSGIANASIVSSEIDYQIFRDFSENKGAFTPGVMTPTY
ncbi:hypothetical protein HV009_04020 [Escherichia coli]|nr:hypothetical protein HVV64_04000 [Escherichia coli]QMB13721.1 hypothetical protein HV009_04020 [Escherichia coli]HCO7775134.1 hypothetical protein [Escherichia coli]